MKSSFVDNGPQVRDTILSSLHDNNNNLDTPVKQCNADLLICWKRNRHPRFHDDGDEIARHFKHYNINVYVTGYLINWTIFIIVEHT